VRSAEVKVDWLGVLCETLVFSTLDELRKFKLVNTGVPLQIMNNRPK
jgi:hypothetical protein